VKVTTNAISMEDASMKKLLSLLTIVCLAVYTIGCTEDETPGPVNGTPAPDLGTPSGDPGMMDQNEELPEPEAIPEGEAETPTETPEPTPEADPTLPTPSTPEQPEASATPDAPADAKEVPADDATVEDDKDEED
jgi:outer membrane biosynthesis protein TonB